MATKIDISDLLTEDSRLPYNWRSAKVKEGELTVLFPHPGYSIDTKKSELRDNGKEWALYINIDKNTLLTLIRKQTITIPDGVERIVLGKVEYYKP